MRYNLQCRTVLENSSVKAILVKYIYIYLNFTILMLLSLLITFINLSGQNHRKSSL